MPLPRHSRSGRSPHCSDANSVPVRPNPVATSSQISSTSCSRHAAPRPARPLGGRRAACRPRPARAARRSPRRAPTRARATIAAARVEAVGVVERRRAQHREARAASNMSAPNPSSPTDSAPIVSPWYAPPNARNVVRPATPTVDPVLERDLERLLDRRRAVGRVQEVRVGRRARPGRAPRTSSITTRLPLPSIVECAPSSSCSRIASSSSGTWWPSVLTQSDEIASR